MVIKTQKVQGAIGIRPVGSKHRQYRHKEVNGKYSVAYKLHVTLSESTFKRDRAILASFLVKYNYSFKMLRLRTVEKRRPDVKGDEARAFTIYPTSETDLLDIVAGIIKLNGKYNLTPGEPDSTGPIVPGTSNLVTYHVERVDTRLLRDMDKAKAFSDRSKKVLYLTSGKLNENRITEIENRGDNKQMVGGGYLDFSSVRVDAMNFLMGGGPLDFLWSEDSSKPKDPPKSKPEDPAKILEQFNVAPPEPIVFVPRQYNLQHVVIPQPDDLTDVVELD